jgi:hypothetical protein
MRDAMERMNISIGGKNGKELQRELQNFAAAEIILGVSDKDGNTHQPQAKVARRLSFWIERPNQKVFWQPEITVPASITTPSRNPTVWPFITGPRLSGCSTTPVQWIVLECPRCEAVAPKGSFLGCSRPFWRNVKVRVSAI